MTPKFPSFTAKEVARVLMRKGFVLDRTSGSHAIYYHPSVRRTTVPIHAARDLGIGLLRQIMKDADITLEDLKE